MKKSKILAPALAILCLSTAASVTGTVAWFAANNVVSASGMTVVANLPSSLAINNELPVGQALSHTFVTPATTLNPVSHFDNDALTAVDGTLYTVKNPYDVDETTGLQKDPEVDLQFEVAGQSQNWVDFTVYIASVGQAITIGAAGKLTADVTFTSTNLTTVNLATTMDFYVYHVVSGVDTGIGTYKGCRNAANLPADANQGAYVGTAYTAEQRPLELLAPGDIIPVNGSSETGLKITMRVYFDGALQSSGTTTYAATNSAHNTNVNIAVAFNLIRE